MLMFGELSTLMFGEYRNENAHDTKIGAYQMILFYWMPEAGEEVL